MQTIIQYTTILKNQRQKAYTVINENQSASINKIEQFYILFLLFVT